MSMNVPLATGILRRFQTNVVGFGLKAQARIDYDALGLSVEAAAEWERKTEREWKHWCESSECDARRSNNFYELQSLAFMAEIMSGDCFVFLPYIPRQGSLYDLRVQVVEADFVSTPDTMQENYKIAGGVEVDKNGAPVAYYLRSFQEDMPIMGFGPSFGTWSRVPAYGELSGRRNVLHVFQAERPGQRRGIPLLAPVIEPLKQLSRLTESELTAAVIASFFTVFIKNTPNGSLGSGFIPEDSVVSSSDPNKSKLYEMGPGTTIGLADNESVEIADPKRPNGAFEPFFLAIIKQIGAAVELPYEQVLLTYNASYSASRGAMLEAWKAFKTRRQRFVSKFCQPIYESWLTEAVLKGRIQAPGYLEDPVLRCAWTNTKWTGPGQGLINPESEINASIKAIENCLSTYEEEYAERTGEDWEPMARTLSRERKLRDELGLQTQQEQKASADLAKIPQANGGEVYAEEKS
jgi:lambda family phage portal protein